MFTDFPAARLPRGSLKATHKRKFRLHGWGGEGGGGGFSPKKKKTKGGNDSKKLWSRLAKRKGFEEGKKTTPGEHTQGRERADGRKELGKNRRLNISSRSQSGKDWGPLENSLPSVRHVPWAGGEKKRDRSRGNKKNVNRRHTGKREG